MGSSRDQQDRIVSTGERPVLPETNVDQPHSPKDERIVSANPSLDAAIRGSSRPAQEQTGLANPGGYLSIIHTPNNLSPYEWDATHGGYAQNMGGWDGYPQYISPEGLHVPPVVYNDNPSLLFHSDFGFNSMPPYILEGQSYSPQQIPFSPTYYPQPAPFGVSSAMHISPTELMTSKSNGESLLIDPWSGYVVPFGSYSGVNFSGTTPLASPVVYPQAMSILGSYEQNTGQLPFHGYAASSSFGGYPHGEPSPSPNYANSPFSYLGSDGRVRLSLDKEGRRERDQDSISITSDSYGNRGPRASRVRGKNLSEPSSSTGNEKKTSASPGPSANLYNQPDFETNYKNAKFFIIKSFSEDNVHKSIKYNVWASTPHGNKKLDAAYHEAKEMGSDCPVFLYFSANASGQFCGVAEMVGPVNFEKDAEYWLQDRWSGQFPVKWHIIKDVPNSRFRHIQLQNNDNKPVTHSRDSQEVKLEQGLEMLKIFKDYDSRTSLIDDFVHYDEREKALGEKKQTELVSATTKNPSASSAEDSLNQISDRLRQTLTLEDSDENRQANETDSRSRKARIDESLGAARSPSLRSEKKSISAASADDKQN